MTRHRRPGRPTALAGAKRGTGATAAELDLLARLKAAGPEKGLASLAGGWEGSEELVKRLAKLRRSGARRTPKLG
jgi:hypothetical protein